MKNTLIELLKVKSIITLAIIGALVFLAVREYIKAETFAAIASSVVTYYFTRKTGACGDESKDGKENEQWKI